MPESQKHAISMSVFLPTRTIVVDPLFSFFLSLFFSSLRFHQTSCTWDILTAAVASIFWGTLSCHMAGVHSNHVGGEQYRMAVAAKTGCYCLENKLRMCGQMVLMVEAYTQLESSEFLKNIWVWWYFSLRTKVVESNFIKYCPWSFIMFQLNRVMNGKSLFYKLFCPKCILSM